MKGRREATLLALLLACLTCLPGGLSGCRRSGTGVPPLLSGDPITVGVPLPLTGSKAAFGEAKRNAYEMAMEEINASGGVDGRPLVLLVRDTAGDPVASAAVAEELITVEQVTLLAGEYSSACALAVAGVAQRHGIPYLVDSAVADAVTQQKWSFVFRLSPPSELLVQGLTDFLGSVVKPRSVAVIYEHSEFGASVARSMRSWCQDKGVPLVAYEGYQAGALDFTAVITRVKQASPDVVFLVSYLLDASLLARQAWAQGLRPKLLAGGAGGFALPEFVANAGEAAENMVVAAPWAPTLPYPGAAEFTETYRARYGTLPPYLAAEAHACVYVLQDALRRAASTDPERLRKALAATDLLTVFGPVRFEAWGKFRNQNRPASTILQVLQGRPEVVWPPEWATASYVFPDPANAAGSP